MSNRNIWVNLRTRRILIRDKKKEDKDTADKKDDALNRHPSRKQSVLIKRIALTPISIQI